MSENNDGATQLVEFWFDPICPWTWITSRWMAEVNEKNNLQVVWQPFSLQVLNEEKNAGGSKPVHSDGHKLGKFFILIKERFGNDKVAEVYTFVGNEMFPGARKDYEAIKAEALAAAGLPPELLEESEADSFDAALRASTERGLELVGPGVGVPIIAINEKAFFGPVLSPAPKGEQALKLWQALEIAITTPGFSELKRGRSGGLNFA